MKGERIGDSPPSTNFLIWWDGDLSRELLDGNHIDKYKVGRIFTAMIVYPIMELNRLLP